MESGESMSIRQLTVMFSLMNRDRKWVPKFLHSLMDNAWSIVIILTFALVQGVPRLLCRSCCGLRRARDLNQGDYKRGENYSWDPDAVTQLISQIGNELIRDFFKGFPWHELAGRRSSICLLGSNEITFFPTSSKAMSLALHPALCRSIPNKDGLELEIQLIR